MKQNELEVSLNNPKLSESERRVKEIALECGLKRII